MAEVNAQPAKTETNYVTRPMTINAILRFSKRKNLPDDDFYNRLKAIIEIKVDEASQVRNFITTSVTYSC